MNTAATTKALYLLHDEFFPDSSTKLLYEETADSAPPAPAPGTSTGGTFQTSEEDPLAVTPRQIGSPIIGRPPQPAPTAVPNPLQDDNERAQNFLVIGQCLWALILGWLGGLFAEFLARRQARLGASQKSPATAALGASPV